MKLTRQYQQLQQTWKMTPSKEINEIEVIDEEIVVEPKEN